MSWFSEAISGGAGARRQALSRVGASAVSEFRTLGNDYAALFNPVIERYTQDRQANMGLYRAEMARAESSFTQYLTQAKQEYGAGMDRAISEMRVGRESTLALSAQETGRQQQSARSMNAFTGLGQTSFGQGRVEAIGRQGTLQQGAITEQYAGQLSSLEAQRAAGISTITAQTGQGLSGMQQSMAANLSNMYQTYSSNIANMQQSGIGQQFNMYQRGIDLNYGAQTQAANLAGGGIAAFGSAASAVGGSLLGGWMSNGFSMGGMSTPNTYSGQYTNQSGGNINGGYNSSGGAVGGR